MTRLRSDIFVSALIRQATINGGFAAVLHKGNAEAGAIAVVIARADRKSALFLPAAQSSYGEDAQERRFRPAFLEVFVEEFMVNERLAKERRFDPDLWVVEIESRDGSHTLDLEN